MNDMLSLRKHSDR